MMKRCKNLKIVRFEKKIIRDEILSFTDLGLNLELYISVASLRLFFNSSALISAY
jgi:hypothetical protein